ncbi:hypothetical protein ACFL35_07350, partial [Candidatus Riflebacteria bacterium]
MDKPDLFLFTSARPQSGKSSLAYHFANALTFHDYPTLFIQVDPASYFPHLKTITGSREIVSDPINPELSIFNRVAQPENLEIILGSFGKKFQKIVINFPTFQKTLPLSILHHEKMHLVLTLLVEKEHILKTDALIYSLQKIIKTLPRIIIFPNRVFQNSASLLTSLLNYPSFSGVPNLENIQKYFIDADKINDRAIDKVFEVIIEELLLLESEWQKPKQTAKASPYTNLELFFKEEQKAIENFIRKDPNSIGVSSQILWTKNEQGNPVMQLKFQKKGLNVKKDFYNNFFGQLASDLLNYHVTCKDNLKEKRAKKLKRFVARPLFFVHPSHHTHGSVNSKNF